MQDKVLDFEFSGKGEGRVTAALSNNKTNGLLHQELKAKAQESETIVTTHDI